MHIDHTHSTFYSSCIKGQEIKKRKSKAKKVRKLTNDELFYDPNLDDEDEKWVEKQRRAYRNGESHLMTTVVCLREMYPFMHIIFQV